MLSDNDTSYLIITLFDLKAGKSMQVINRNKKLIEKVKVIPKRAYVSLFSSQALFNNPSLSA